MYEFIAAPVTAWFLAHLIKFSAAAFRGDVNLAWLWRSGGMPSSHAATVVALTTTIGLFLGFGSPHFAITATFAAVVIYDSVGVRQAVGNHSKILDVLRKEIGVNSTVKETLGHSSIEVLSGFALGLIVGAAYSTSKITSISTFLSTPLAGVEFRIVWLLTSALFLVALVYNYIYLRSRKTITYKRLKKTVFYSIMLPCFFGFIFILLAQQGVSSFNWRVWVWSVLVLIVALQIVLASRFYKHIPKLVKEDIARSSEKIKPKRNSKKRRKK